jgi:hypothetical protein
VFVRMKKLFHFSAGEGNFARFRAKTSRTHTFIINFSSLSLLFPSAAEQQQQAQARATATATHYEDSPLLLTTLCVRCYLITPVMKIFILNSHCSESVKKKINYFRSFCLPKKWHRKKNLRNKQTHKGKGFNL